MQAVFSSERISNPPADNAAKCTDKCNGRRIQKRHLQHCHPERALEIGRPEIRGRIAHERRNRDRHDEVHCRATRDQAGEPSAQRRHWRGMLRHPAGVRQAAPRLHHQQPHDNRQHNARQADRRHCPAPAIGAGNHPADDRAKPAAQHHARRVNRHGACALFRRIEICNNRMRRRARPRLPHAHPDPVEKKLGKIGRGAAQRRHCAPERQRQRDNVAAARAVGEPRHRDAKRRVKQRKRKSRQQTQLRIVQLQVDLDRLQQDRQDIPVHKAEEINQSQQRQRPAAQTDGAGISRHGGIKRQGCHGTIPTQ